MTADLWCLIVLALWGVALVQIEVAGKTKAAGTDWNVGNRATEPKFPDWVNRCGRALGNHKENFPVFLTAVLVVHLAGKEDKISDIGCVVFVIFRVLHGLIYIAGVTKVRSAMFIAGALAQLVILSRLVMT